MPATASSSTSTTITLQPISLKQIRHGGYRIRYTGDVPSGARVKLCIPDRHHSIDITNRNRNDVLDRNNLPALLNRIAQQSLWGRRARCKIAIIQGDNVLAESEPQQFDCPLQPYTGELKPELGNGLPSMTYTRETALCIPAIEGRYFIEKAVSPVQGQFETRRERRGLDCITYAGAVFGVSRNTGAMSAYGTQLANHVNAVQCGLENKTGEQIKQFFAESPAGTYLMWSETHVVVIVNSTVHEFSQSRNGYVVTPIHDWRFGRARYWVRRTPKQFSGPLRFPTFCLRSETAG